MCDRRRPRVAEVHCYILVKSKEIVLRQTAVIAKSLLISGFLAVLAWVSVRHVLGSEDDPKGFVAHLGAWTGYKVSWIFVLGAVVLALWALGRSHGGKRGVLWGLWVWLLQLGFGWSVVGLLLLASVVIVGATQQSPSELRWPLLLLSLLILLPIVISTRMGLSRAGAQR
jgi:hypothetical protein